jgi:hypothetical protein
MRKKGVSPPCAAILAKQKNLFPLVNKGLTNVFWQKRHFNKAACKLNGSIGFLGIARAVLSVTVDPDNPESDRRIPALMINDMKKRYLSPSSRVSKL